jgi:ubiquinone/menaquinone biosynthesis C-methylase UbiE
VSGAEERLANDPTSELWGEHRSRYRFAAQFVAGQRVLDVACGSGFGLQMLADAGARPVGVDNAGDTLLQIRQRSPDSTLVRADATRLPLQTASIDQVVSFETIEHVPDAPGLVHEVRRVLKPGGRLVLSTPNRAFGPLERHTANRFHVREFTADELRELLGECFRSVRLFGQRPSRAYRYVPYLMVGPHREPSALAWKASVRLPFAVRNRMALMFSGRPFYPNEVDYCFDPEDTDGAHALVAVAQ